MKRRLIALAMLLASGAAAAPDYALQARAVAPDVWMFEGLREHFTRANGGNIVNTGFIIAPQGVIVIDSGPSRLYGEQMRARIAALAPDRPVTEVLITHAHPDHFLGNQAYADARIAALPDTVRVIGAQGEALSANLYRLVGAWMQGTEVRTPQALERTGAVELAGRRLQLIALSGHTGADLAVYDESTRTLFAGDLVFFQRAATTPNADLRQWLAALDRLQQLDYRALVPGHGPVVHDASAIAQTRDYLRWLRDSLQSAATRGLDMVEVMREPVPERFRTLAVVNEERARSVSHLYPSIEEQTLAPARP